ncbi:MAG: Uma2 family endonuclease [Defluviitaleaceae bacterium]|nr:Uma2 family endonuclease [Defluviitaleaceae bacterium]
MKDVPVSVLGRWEEVINSKVVEMEPEDLVTHQNITHNIINELKSKIGDKKYRVYGSGVGVLLKEGENFVPDVIIVDENIITDDGIQGVPKFVAEVICDKSEIRDRGYKKDLYEKMGVEEYWIVCPVNKFIEVYHLQNYKYVLSNIYNFETDKAGIFSLYALNDIIFDIQNIF